MEVIRVVHDKTAWKCAVAKFLDFQEDDENDTALFERLQEQVLSNFPNPNRIGCPSRGVLEEFVASPSRVSVEELNDLHIFQCAECTRDLLELRRTKERHG